MVQRTGNYWEVIVILTQTPNMQNCIVTVVFRLFLPPEDNNKCYKKKNIKIYYSHTSREGIEREDATHFWMAPNHCNFIVIWCKGSHLDIGWDLAEKHPVQIYPQIKDLRDTYSRGVISKLDIKQLIVALSRYIHEQSVGCLSLF